MTRRVPWRRWVGMARTLRSRRLVAAGARVFEAGHRGRPGRRARFAGQGCSYGIPALRNQEVIPSGCVRSIGRGRNPVPQSTKNKEKASSTCLMRDNPKIARIPLFDEIAMASVTSEVRIAVPGRRPPAYPSVADGRASIEPAACPMRKMAPFHHHGHKGFLRRSQRWLVGS